MKKHFWGFALFSFIVGISAIIYGMFNVLAVEEVGQSYTATYSPTKSCWKMKRESSRTNFGSPMVKQAVFNLKSKQLRWELDTSEVNTPVALNFFIKDEKGTRYVNSTFVPMSAYRDNSVRATSSYLWLDNLESYENLYVIAEPVLSGAYKNKNFQPNFDARRATAVLVY
jgi:hypothetical protein